MRDPFANPFPSDDTDRRAIWDMLVPRDIDAFLAADWGMVADDFVEDEFIGIHGQHGADPDNWTLAFPTLDLYRDEWLAQAKDFATQEFAEDTRTAIFNATRLEEITINGDRALVHKKFDGGIKKADGTFDRMNWQTLYYCKRVGGRFLISGFTGYLPYPMGKK